MATDTLYKHVRQASSGGSSSAMPPAPGSPTLTNPDMILPDYDAPASPDHASPQITAWRASHTSPLDFHLPHSNYSSAPVHTPTPIIYGNGTMLSDIGEVTEVESNAGYSGRRNSRYSTHSTDEPRLNPALFIGKPITHGRNPSIGRERRASIDSTSTITSNGHAAQFADFDETASVGDASFLGDDEESLASSYVDNAMTGGPYRHRSAHLNGDMTLNPDRYSTSSISKRAEQILANAKRRLTTMEGNLTRARSSLNNYGGISDGSTPSPPIARPSTALRAPTTSITSSQLKSLGENGNADTPISTMPLTRSASALGAAGGYRKPRASTRSLDAPIEGVDRYNNHYSLASDRQLNPLDEEDDQTYGPGRQQDDLRMTDLASPTSSIYSDTGRLSSMSSVRDLQDQMNGLKGKISSLKEQARADSLKRRSLQSLRTPSPFTHALGFSEPPEPREEHTVAKPAEDKTQEPANAPADDVDAAQGERAMDGLQKAVEPVEHRQQEVAQPRGKNEDDGATEIEEDEAVDVHSENGSSEGEQQEPVDIQDETREDYDTASESGESLYHDTFQAPVSHEDREDAFDYEHFFLHSAMGTINRGQLSRSPSTSSFESIETTRGPMPMDPRPDSTQTMSSVDSFATANEGRASRNKLAYINSDLANGYREYDDATPNGPTSGNTHSRSGSERGSAGEPRDSNGSARRNSVLHRPLTSSASKLHRPSVASFESTGTNRSFPLVPKAKANGSRSSGGSSEGDHRQMMELLLRSATRSSQKGNGTPGTPGTPQTPSDDGSTSALQMLAMEDQLNIERLVAGLGRSMVVLAESSRAGSETRLTRRRIEAARRILEGLDENFQ